MRLLNLGAIIDPIEALDWNSWNYKCYWLNFSTLSLMIRS